MALPPLVLSRLPPGARSLLSSARVDEPEVREVFDLDALAGRMSELQGDSALTLAFALVRDAQLRDEPAAYVTGVGTSFYPPDVADGGVDLDALVVIRIGAEHKASVVTPRARAVDELLRSGAFALVVLDLTDASGGRVPPALLSRLHALAQKHHSAIVFLTASDEDAPSALGSLVSLRALARRRTVGESRTRFEIVVEIVKDKRRAPGWTHTERCRAPLGMA